MKQLSGFAVIVSGPSGVGKSTLGSEARRRFASLKFSISCTTRPPRGSERDGVEYFFLERAEFERKIANGEFAEYAEVFSNYYGTLKSQLLTPVRNGENVFLDIDVQGAMQIRELCRIDPEFARICEFVFVAPPSLAVLEERLRRRHTDSEEQLAQRLGKAAYEISFADKYNYIIVNDDLQTATEEFMALLQAFPLSTKRREVQE